MILNPASSVFALAPHPSSRTFAGDPPESLIISIV
ncbi:MAG: hypothetical protein QG576_849, partial [Bacteroidota bacterium]|nr:hypothetical protein [Bacteroidota bacterium]